MLGIALVDTTCGKHLGSQAIDALLVMRSAEGQPQPGTLHVDVGLWTSGKVEAERNSTRPQSPYLPPSHPSENKMFLPHIELALQTMLLGMEAHAVIGLRLRKIADGGPAALVEAHRMIAEKTAAMAEAAATLIGGGSAQTVVRDFRSHVRANEVRLLGLGQPRGGQLA
jgi:hypothetical protein